MECLHTAAARRISWRKIQNDNVKSMYRCTSFLANHIFLAFYRDCCRISFVELEPKVPRILHYPNKNVLGDEKNSACIMDDLYPMVQNHNDLGDKEFSYTQRASGLWATVVQYLVGLCRLLWFHCVSFKQTIQQTKYLAPELIVAFVPFENFVQLWNICYIVSTMIEYRTIDG